jgi:hypothetical protein
LQGLFFMAISFDFGRLGDLPAIEDDIRGIVQDNFNTGRSELDEIARELNGSGIADFNGLAALADRLPADLRGPDATGEVPTGSAVITRAEADTGARLATAPRIIEALGPEALTFEIPSGIYDIVDRYADPVSGFSAVRLRPRDGGDEVFAVDGLEVGSRADEVSAAGLGTLQVESAAFREMIDDALGAALNEGRGLLFTGPSLGGAVSQVAAYEAAEGLLASGRGYGPGAVELVTVDPLGGRDAAEQINGTLDPAALGLIDAVNLRTEGDIVSRIGSHIGATLTLPAVDAEGNRVQLNAADAHVNTVSLLEVLGRDDLFAQGVYGPPGEISGFATVSNSAGQALGDAWILSGGRDDEGRDALQITGTASFDPSGTRWSLDADDNGSSDVAVQLAAPASQATADLVLG